MKNLIRILLLVVFLFLSGWLLFGKKTTKDEVYVVSWDNYIAEDTLSSFEQKSSSDVVYELMKSNEEGLAKLKGNPGLYDVMVFSDYMVKILHDEGLLQPIDWSKISQKENIDPAFRGAYYDPELAYSVPYAYGTAAFAVNTKYFPESGISWKQLANPTYKGKIAIMDDMRYVLGSVLMELGYSPNTHDKTQIDAAVALLKEVMPNVQKFTADTPVDLMVNEKAWIAYGYSGDIFQMQEGNESVEYRAPAYGAIKFADSLVIPANAPHLNNAHAYMDHILTPEISAGITNAAHYGNPTTTALSLIDEMIRSNKSVFPPKEVQEKLQFIEDVGEDIALYDTAWTQIKQ